jgi:16S rRNA processing protein RimM
MPRRPRNHDGIEDAHAPVPSVNHPLAAAGGGPMSDLPVQATAWTTVAQILRPQGRKGELLAELLTDFPERFETDKQVYLASPGFNGTAADARTADVAHFWLPVGRNEGRIVLHFAGIDSIEAAEKLMGLDVLIPETERIELEDDASYISDLVGCVVYEQETAIGVVADVHFAMTPDGARRLDDAAPLLEVEGLAGEEFLIPFAKSFLVSLDVPAKKIVMQLPAGLLDINRAG